jgi:hypothetical protein
VPCCRATAPAGAIKISLKDGGVTPPCTSDSNLAPRGMGPAGGGGRPRSASGGEEGPAMAAGTAGSPRRRRGRRNLPAGETYLREKPLCVPSFRFSLARYTILILLGEDA